MLAGGYLLLFIQKHVCEWSAIGLAEFRLDYVIWLSSNSRLRLPMVL